MAIKTDFLMTLQTTLVDEVSLLHTLGCSGLRRIVHWTDVEDSWTLHLLEKPSISFPPLSPLVSTKRISVENSLKNIMHTPSNPFGVPTLAEWRGLWAAWDLVTLSMIPPGMLHDKPIDLRHKCLFYIGHIPT